MYQSQNSSPKDNIKFSVKRFHCFSCLNSSENHEKIVFSGCSLEGLGELDRNIRYSHLYRSRFSSGWWSNSRWDCRGTRRGVGWGDDTDEVRQQSCVKSLPQSPSALCSQYWVTRKQDGQVRADNSLLLFSIKESPPPCPPFSSIPLRVTIWHMGWFVQRKRSEFLTSISPLCTASSSLNDWPGSFQRHKAEKTFLPH